MNIRFKLTAGLYRSIRKDLGRRHSFAAERVGFVACRVGSSLGGILIVAHDYYAVQDDHYIDTDAAGAMISSDAIRSALQHALTHKVSMFHVHEHGGAGPPNPSSTDTREWANFVPNFWNVQPHIPHGAVILSQDSATGFCWVPGRTRPIEIAEFSVIDIPLQIWRRAQ
jgi:hypothetical protein